MAMCYHYTFRIILLNMEVGPRNNYSECVCVCECVYYMCECVYAHIMTYHVVSGFFFTIDMTIKYIII